MNKDKLIEKLKEENQKLKELLKGEKMLLKETSENFYKIYKEWHTLIKKPQNKKEFREWMNE